MTIADNGNGNAAAQPEPSKRRLLKTLSDDQWKIARLQYETAGAEISYRQIAAAFGVSKSAVDKRGATEKWTKQAQIVQKAASAIAFATDKAIDSAADKAAQTVAASLMKDLAPWIEKEKREHIQRAIKRSKRALKRITAISKGYDVQHPKTGEIVTIEPGPKDEMHIAAAEDKYDGIIRRNLGMNETPVAGGSLSLRILTEGAAIEVTQGKG